MKLTLLIIILSTLLASCATYQYHTLHAVQGIKNSSNDIVWENDTLALTYNFSGQWGKVDIQISNKTDEPVYINWMKSVIITGSQSASLYDPLVQINGHAVQSTNQLIPDTPSARIDAYFKLPAAIDFMAPHTTVKRHGVNIAHARPTLPVLPGSIPVKKARNEYGTAVSYRESKYDSLASPFSFRLYLTFGIGTHNKEFILDHSFYVAEVLQTDNSPGLFFLYRPRGDIYYIKL